MNMCKGRPQTVEDLEGAWQDPDINSGLIQHCRDYWNVPVQDFPDAVLASFLRQEIALQLVILEAKRRVDGNEHDDSELYEGELADALGQVDWPDE